MVGMVGMVGMEGMVGMVVGYLRAVKAELCPFHFKERTLHKRAVVKRAEREKVALVVEVEAELALCAD